MALKILGIHADVCNLGGHTRCFLMFMDIFKGIGYQVHIASRMKKDSVAKVDMPAFDPKKKKQVLIPDVEARVKTMLSHHKLSAIKKYQPIRHLNHRDISMEDIPIIHWVDHFLTPFSDKVLGMIEDADFIFCDTEMYVRMERDLDIAKKHIQFIHFPTVNLKPVFGREPRLWCNSTFTRSWIRIRWGYNNPNYTMKGKEYTTIKIPNQVFNAEVIHPPLYVDDYENDVGFDERFYDVVMFSRLGEDKFTVAGFLNENFKLLTMGALSPTPPGMKKSSEHSKQFTPSGKLHKTVTFKQLISLLRKAKVYVHGKGFKTLPEHFGITICEAMASGCPAIVPRSGGCWTDISELGKHTLAYSSLEELKTNVEVLTTNREEWEKWRMRGLNRVASFDVARAIPRINSLIG